MSRRFEFAIAVSLLLIAFAALRFSENGRYRYLPETEHSTEIIVDTRTGEFWHAGTDFVHVDPRNHVVTEHPVVYHDRKYNLEVCLDGKSASWLLHPFAMHYCHQGQVNAGSTSTTH